MTSDINGLHHVTAISGAPQENFDFYASLLGQRFVKKTVNFDDPSTYHLYYGTESGAPGTIMTFFPWSDIPKGRIGAGQVAITQFAVPKGSLPFWNARLVAAGTRVLAQERAFDAARLVFEDPHGLVLALVEADDARSPWLAGGIAEDVAIRGFHGVTIALHEPGQTRAVLENVLEYVPAGEEAFGDGTLIRLTNGQKAGVVDLHIDPNLPKGLNGAGTIHHVAFSTPNRAAQVEVQAKLRAAGQHVTEQIDRDYFWAIYSRMPEGVLFEVATDEPGFDVDEPLETLGASLRLPRQHEEKRAWIEKNLPVLETH